MNFWQRLRFFLIGFVPGCIILFFIVSKKGCTSPNELKMQELLYQTFKFSPKAECKLKCLDLTYTSFKIEMRDYEVNYDVSKVHQKPCGEYYIQGKDKNKNPRFEVMIRDCDTISNISDIKILAPALKCDCDTLSDKIK